jgi:Ca2+:H+ antiporter
MEHWIITMGAPKSLSGVIISTVVLLPEGISAIRAAQKNHLQISLNQALGSALASTGLTIPVVALVGLIGGRSIELGIDAKSTVLLLLSSYIVFLSLRTGRTNILEGIILLVIFAVYLFTTIFP